MTTIDEKIIRLHEKCGDVLDRLKTSFIEPVKMTLFVRNPAYPDSARDVLVTDDSVAEVVAAMTRLESRPTKHVLGTVALDAHTPASPPPQTALDTAAKKVVAAWKRLGKCEDEFGQGGSLVPVCGEYADALDDAIIALEKVVDAQ